MKNYEQFTWAKSFIKENKYEEAHEILKKIYIEEPYDKNIKFQYAKVLCKIKNKNIELAKKLFLEINDKYSKFELAKLEMQSGNNDVARKYFEELTRLGDKYSKFELAKLEIKTKNFPTAYKYLVELVASGDKYSKFELAKLETRMGKYESAEKHFEELLEERIDSYVLLDFSKLKLITKKYDEARIYLEKLLHMRKKDKFLAQIELVKLETKLGNIKEAEKILFELENELEKSIQNKIYRDYDLSMILNVGKLYADLDNLDKAREKFNYLIDTDNFSIAYLELGRLEVSVGNIKEAKTIFNKLPENASARLELARLENDSQKARILFKELFNSTVKEAAKFDLALLEIKESNLDIATSYLLELLNTHKSIEAKMKLAKIELQKENFNLARKYLTELYNLELPLGDKIRVEFNLAKVDAASGYIEKALKTFKKLTEVDEYLPAKFELARLEADLGNIVIAKKYFQELLLEKQGEYSKLELARLEADLGNIDVARGYLEELLNTENRACALLELAKLEFSQENIEIGKVYLKELLTLSETDKIYAAQALGRIELKEGNVEQASYYFSILENYQDSTLAQSALLNFKTQQEDYEGALEHLDKLYDLNYQKLELGKFLIYIKYKLNRLNEENYTNNYFDLQLVDYNIDLALDHIFYNLDRNDRQLKNCCFLPEVDLEDLFNIVQEKIQNLKCLNSGIYDIYVVQLDSNVGIYNNKETSLIEVSTICNTKNIIAMNPIASRYKRGQAYRDKQKVIEIN